MGRSVVQAVKNSGTVGIIAGVDINPQESDSSCNFPVYQSINDFPGKADVIVDFSNHAALPALTAYAVEKKTPLVIATTGHTEQETELMHKASESVAVFFSRNMSIGINLLIRMCREASAALGEEFDIEIIEKHHNKKLDAPSGTAMMIAEALKDERECETEFVYDRHEVRRPRDSREIGIHAVRGGTIVGEHEVVFAGNNEIVTLSHSAMSREIFANGAIRAAEFVRDKKSGFYGMEDLLREKNIK